MVNRMRPLLNRMVEPTKVAFVHDRGIIENVVLVQEMVNFNETKGGKKGFLGIRLDFLKAYDKMEWSFLKAMLKAFGFNEKFINLVLQRLPTVNFTLLMNGGIASSFTPQRGLRQGDPIFHFLFILGCEVLMRLINRELSNGNLRGVKVASSTLPISKLCYADDVLLFCSARMDELIALTRCLVFAINLAKK